MNISNNLIYADVDGVWHITSKDGEPDCPLSNNVKVVIVVKNENNEYIEKEIM